MQAATAQALAHDRICSWQDEVQRILPSLPFLAPGAQRAVGAVIASIVEEDERLGVDWSPASANLSLMRMPSA